MANYVFIQNYSKKGKIGISLGVFDALVMDSLAKVKGIDVSLQESKKNKKIKLHKPITTSLLRGILHVSVLIDVAKGENIQNVCNAIQEEITNTLLACTEQIPFDVQIKVMSLY